MDYYSGYINQLIEQLSHLPGIGVKTAQRLAFHIMTRQNGWPIRSQKQNPTSSTASAARP